MSKSIFITLFFVLLSLPAVSQRVGLVLSGGGAAGFAHIGVIKALEENNVPIDYITGTSAGSLVGGLYACGLSIKQIEEISMSEEFYLMVNGDTERQYKFNLRREDDNASMVNLSFSRDSILFKSLPTNFITPALFDYEMLRIFGVVGASRSQNFDSLFVPFRCVAADIKNKKEHIFRSGNLNHAIRASMTFPFYVNPIRVDGALLFDGGLYNNFPADIMYYDFNPDFIIGSNVSDNSIDPSEDDLFSQMKAAMVRETKFEIPCDYGLMIEHDMQIGTFDFDKVQNAIQIGYDNTIKMIDSLRLYVRQSRSAEELALRRSQFSKSIVPLNISSSESVFQGEKRASFVNYPIQKRLERNAMNESALKRYYFELYGTPQIRYVLPEIELQKDSTYHLKMEIKKTKDFSLNVGGHFSSRPVNTGYVGLSYYHINRLAWRANVESYFGKFYGSGKLSLDLHVPSRFPFVISPYFVLNRWDYFRSLATFFEPVRPSFLVQEETYTGMRMLVPLSMTFRAGLDYRNFSLFDRYYQTDNFTNADTTDLTNFYGNSAQLSIEHNSLNRKQFASEGSSFRLSLRYVQGVEHSVSGSTAPIPFDEFYNHQWVNFQLDSRKYFNFKKKYAVGIHGLAAFNSQSLFRNYVASLLAMTEFSPIPDAKTVFMEEYRAPQYIAGGLNQVFNLFNRLELRIDAYAFQPIIVLRRFDDGDFGYSQYQLQPKFIGSSSLIFHSPIGPFRATMNYFPEQSKPFTFLLSFGYIIFNERAIR
jgi:NTE family protein